MYAPRRADGQARQSRADLFTSGPGRHFHTLISATAPGFLYGSLSEEPVGWQRGAHGTHIDGQSNGRQSTGDKQKLESGTGPGGAALLNSRVRTRAPRGKVITP